MQTCTGSSKDSSSCACTFFVSKSPPKENRCDGCGHRRSVHAETTSSTNKYVSRFLKNIAATAVHEEARRETVQGFRPQQPSTATGIGNGKAPSHRRVSARPTSGQRQSSSSTGSMKIGRIVIFPCGAENLNRFRFPTIDSASLAPWVSAQLAIEANPADESGIVFQLDWGTKEFNDFLRTLFPRLFDYLGTINPSVLNVGSEPDNVGLKRIDYSWPYILLKKNRKKYEAVDCTHPTASTYRDNLSGDTTRTSFRGKAMFLATKKPIPQEIIEKWFAPGVAPTIPHSVPPRKRGRALTVSSSSSASDTKETNRADADNDAEANTDGDEVQVVKTPPKLRPRPTKRVRAKIDTSPNSPSSAMAQLRSPHSPLLEFIEGSSTGTVGTAHTRQPDPDATELAKRLQASASIDDKDSIWNKDRNGLKWTF